MRTEEPNYGYTDTIVVPETPTLEYLEGIWYGYETGNPDEGYGEESTFVMILGANGKGTVSHSERGEFNVYSAAIKDDHIEIYTQFGTLYLVYNYGSFTLRTQESYDLSFTKGTYLAMIKIAGAEQPEEHEHNFVDGKCECGETDPNYNAPVEAPAEISREYLAGTWYGTETGAFDYAGEHTFVIIIDEYGKSGIVKHSALGEFKITGITILDGNSVMMDLTSDTYMISLEYNNGVFTLADGKNFTYGREEFYMSKTAPETPEAPHEHEFVDGKCECGEEDPNYVPPVEPEYPEYLDYDYLTGTWTGTETDWQGNIHTFSIEFDGQMGIVTHSSLGTFKVIVEISYGMIYTYSDCEYQPMLMYSEGTIYLLEGTRSFTGGSVLAMTKGEAEEPAPAPHEHTFMYACDAHCMECGELVNENAAHSITLVKGTPATCTVDGKADVYMCEICGYGWLDAELTSIANLMSIVIIAPGHSYMFDCDATCMVCGELTNEDAAHSIALVPGTPASCTVDGKADVYACEICGYGWLDEELTIIANPMSIVIFATGHDFDAANCTSPKTCAICDETEGEALGHADDNGDFKCDRCSTKVLPAADETLTIAQAIALGKLYTKDTYTSDKYYITGIITEVQNTQYGNLVISDGTNSILVYGLYSYDGKTRYDAMSYKPVPGDEITVWGVIGYYTDAQMKNGWMDEVVQHSHEYADATCEAPATCTLCGLTQGEKADHNYVDGTCTMCGNSEGVTIVEKTLSFSSKSNRTTYTTSQQVWEQNGVTLTNDKSSSTSNVGDYYNPARFYKSSKITIDCAGMTKIVFVCNSSSYASALNSSIGTVSGATVTVSGSNVTVEFDAPVDTFVIANLSGGQVRVNSLTVYAAE